MHEHAEDGVSGPSQNDMPKRKKKHRPTKALDPPLLLVLLACSDNKVSNQNKIRFQNKIKRNEGRKEGRKEDRKQPVLTFETGET